MKDQIFWFIAAVLYLALLMVLVRPGSQGPQLVENVLGTLTDLVRGVAGYTYSNGQWTAPSGGTQSTATVV